MENPLDNFTMKSKDEDIVETVKIWVKDSETYHDYLLKQQTISENYYRGKQTEMEDVPAYLSDTVENRIFEAVETIVPIVTANNHQFKVLAPTVAEDSTIKATKLQKVLTYKYGKLNMQKKLEDITRHILLFRFGVLKYLWDSEMDDIDVKVIDPRLILVPQLRLDPHELPYTIEMQAYTYEEIELNFPDVDMDELSKGQHMINTGERRHGDDHTPADKLYEVFEVWTPEMVAWVNGSEVLDKKVNPYYDFKGREKKIYNDKTKKYKKELKFDNHLDAPETPFIFFGTFNISHGPLPSTSLVEIGIPIQDDINARKRSIINNLKQMGNGQVYIDSDSMTQEEADNMTNEPGLILRGTGLASENKIRREPGVPLPSAHFSAYQSSQVAFDNVMGIHPSTRGAGDSPTLGQDIISRQQDFTRIDSITRVLNRGMARLANGLVQLMRMYYTESHLVKIIGEKDALEIIGLIQDDIEDHVEIEVTSGVTLPMDDIALRTEAVQLWQLGALDPVTLYERLKFPEPKKAAQSLLMWKQGQLDMETQASIQQAQGGAQANASAKAETPETAGQGRSTEGMLDVLARARKSLGGQAPAAGPNTSNENKK